MYCWSSSCNNSDLAREGFAYTSPQKTYQYLTRLSLFISRKGPVAGSMYPLNFSSHFPALSAEIALTPVSIRTPTSSQLWSSVIGSIIWGDFPQAQQLSIIRHLPPMDHSLSTLSWLPCGQQCIAPEDWWSVSSHPCSGFSSSSVYCFLISPTSSTISLSSPTRYGRFLRLATSF